MPPGPAAAAAQKSHQPQPPLPPAASAARPGTCFLLGSSWLGDRHTAGMEQLVRLLGRSSCQSPEQLQTLPALGSLSACSWSGRWTKAYCKGRKRNQDEGGSWVQKRGGKQAQIQLGSCRVWNPILVQTLQVADKSANVLVHLRLFVVEQGYHGVSSGFWQGAVSRV